jgi:hypothetical protein
LNLGGVARGQRASDQGERKPQLGELHFRLPPPTSAASIWRGDAATTSAKPTLAARRPAADSGD